MKEALYVQTARILAERIASGHYPKDSLLPTEMELCKEFQVSRHTIRAAIRELQELGLVSRKKKAGTKIEEAPASSKYSYSLASQEELSDFGTRHRRSVQKIETIVVDQTLSKELACSPGVRKLRISSLRLDEGDTPPVGWTDVYVDPSYTDLPAIMEESPEMLVSSLLETRYGRRITGIKQDIYAVTVPEHLIDVLQTDASTPALKIIRYYYDSANKAAEVSVTIHPAGRFVFSTRLSKK